MRKIYVLTISLFLIVSAWGQEGKEVFPTDDFTVWNVVRTYECFHESQLLYAIYGDTIIKDIAYKKMYMLNDTLPHIDEQDLYYGGIRVEGSKVYFRSGEYKTRPVVEHESLLYDFDVQVGDIVKHGTVESLSVVFNYSDIMPSGGFVENVKSAVKEVFFDEYGRKHIKSYNDITGGLDEWIEGVGSIYGFFWPYCDYPTDGRSYNFDLQCLKTNNEIKYLGHNECDCCFFKLKGGVAGVKSENNPAPFTLYYDDTNRFIELAHNESNGSSFVLFNALGQKVKEVSLKECVEVIRLGEELSGVFIYTIVEDEVMVGKGKLVIK